ncbi:hypothetical protein BSKO_04984 [Bryopsis sp. KO-2023]|nr:hypothetical protein BSKO_04984 [Bryopsis sp. KO-2023]
MPPLRNPIPTPYLQARFCKQASEGSGRDEALFESKGFRLEPRNQHDIQSLPFHAYLPKYFPRDRTEARDFDWDACPKELSVGFYVRGTDSQVLRNYVDDFHILAQIFLQSDEPMLLANRNCSVVIRRLDGLLERFPELKHHGITLRVYLAGHSLGGMVSAAVAVMLQHWADHHNATIHCTTFESPGLTQHYWRLASEQNPDSDDFDVWRERITNYVSMPNWINMCHPHLGRVVHLDNDEVEVTAGWVAQCALSSALRLWGWGGALRVLGLLGTGGATAAQLSTATSRFLTSALGPAEVGPVICWYYYVEKEVLVRKHGMGHLLDCFSPDSGGLPYPHMAVEMRKWPTYGSFKKTLSRILMPVLRSVVPFHPDNVGLHNVMNKRDFMRRKLAKLDGYEPMPYVKTFFQMIGPPEDAKLEREPDELDMLLAQ